MSRLNKFELIGAAMYELLDEFPSKVLIGCSSVNPRHPMPKEHEKFISFIESKKSFIFYKAPPIKNYIASFLILLIFTFKETIKIIFFKIYYYKKIKHFLNQKYDVIFKTWFYQANQTNDSDFYLGDLPKSLKLQGIKTLVIGKDLSKKKINKKKFAFYDDNNFNEFFLIPISAPIKIFLLQLRNSILLLGYSTKNQFKLSSIIAKEASIECLSISTFVNNTYFYISRNATIIWNPKAFITLYEGQPWEKAAWLGIKNISEKCKIIGFQHTIIMGNSWGLIKPYKKYVPNAVIASGTIPINKMLLEHKSYGTVFINLGSYKRLPKSINDINQKKYLQTILVVPEGTLKESIIMFDFAIKSSKILPNYKFIFRTHPILPFQNVQSYLCDDIKNFSNIELSENIDINVDFSISSAVLYRGTSVVLYAILAGLKPFYLDTPNFNYVDPLSDLNQWRIEIRNDIDFIKELNQYRFNEKDIEIRNSWVNAVSFINDYISEINPHALKEIYNLI